ncbi:DUF1629 domain-containing protein (plasmid) [Leptospira sp. WS60.C2]
MEGYEYFVFSARTDPRFCSVENLDEKIEEYWLLSECVRMGNRFPKSVVLDLTKDAGDYITDFINNIHSVVIVSQQVKAVFEAEGIGDEKVEYLPIGLRDKKKKRLKEQYFIANALVKVDCFDWKNSTYATYPKKPNKIVFSSLRKLVLREDQIPNDAKFFRLGELTDKILIRSDLLNRLKAEELTGMSVTAMGARLL